MMHEYVYIPVWVLIGLWCEYKLLSGHAYQFPYLQLIQAAQWISSCDVLYSACPVFNLAKRNGNQDIIYTKLTNFPVTL